MLPADSLTCPWNLHPFFMSCTESNSSLNISQCLGLLDVQPRTHLTKKGLKPRFQKPFKVQRLNVLGAGQVRGEDEADAISTAEFTVGEPGAVGNFQP